MLPNKSSAIIPLDYDRPDTNKWYEENRADSNDFNKLGAIEPSYDFKAEPLDPRKNLMTPKRFFKEKEINEKAAKLEEIQKMNDEKKRKHVRKPIAKHLQEENLAHAASQTYHIFYDEVCAYVFFLRNGNF